MKKAVLFLAALAVLAAGQAQAATAAKAATPQQNKMKTCATQYHQQNIAKSQYHNFMSQCLKTKTSAKTAAKK